MILLDTNILLRFKNPNAPQYLQISEKITDFITDITQLENLEN